MYEQRALLGQVSGVNRAPSVDTNTIIDYLNHDPKYNSPQIQFDSTISMPWLKPHISRLANQARKVNVFPQSFRDQMDVIREVMTDLPPGLAEIVGRLVKEKRAVTGIDPDEVQVGERHKLVYLIEDDDGKPKIQATRIKFGEFSEVEVGTEFARALGKTDSLLVDIHTHPDGKLLSFQDYSLVISPHPFLKNPNRLVNAQVIVGPNDQLLSLATPETPIMPSINEAVKFTQSLNDECDKDFESYFRKAMNFDLAADFYLLKRLSKLLLYGYAHSFELEEKSLANKYTEKEMDQIIALSVRRDAILTADLLSFYQKLSLGLGNIIGKDANAFLNARLLEVADFMKVKLYRSTNMKDFHSFEVHPL